MRIYQVNEGVEGGDMVGFIKILLTEKLEMPPKQSLIVAEH